jgi:putative ABC transport system permease protein
MKLPLPFRLARRELRAGSRGFRILIACLALGVGTIAAVQSLSSDIVNGIAAQGRELLGGDVAVRIHYHAAAPDQLQVLQSYGQVSQSVDLRGMARTADGRRSTLVEVKAVDPIYPLVGKVDLAPPANATPLADLLAQRDGVWGVAVEPGLLARLSTKVGDRLSLGNQSYEVRAVINREPDRVGTGFTLGPRFLIPLPSLPQTGLIQPGSMIYYDYRIALDDGRSPQQTVRELNKRFAGEGWHVRDSSEAAPEIRQFIDRLATFLTLVGLTALLVGGVGVGNAVKSYLDGRLAVIATMKCLGAPGRLIAWTYLIQVMVLAAIGIAIGLVTGATVPWALKGVIADNFPVPITISVHPHGLAMATAYGALIALAFSLWPIGRARGVPAGALFRELVAPAGWRPNLNTILATGVTLAVLIALVLTTAGQRVFTTGFIIGAIGSFMVLGAAARLVAALSRRIARLDPVKRRPTLRLALANINRPGSATVSVLLSLGLGLTILVAIAQVEADFHREVERDLPAEAPAFFFVDIQKADADRFRQEIIAVPGVEKVEMVPSLRGRIVGARGLPADKAVVDRKHDWVLAGDRGITYATAMPPRSRLISGVWWPPNYFGPPELSISTEVAEALGLKVGDPITINVVGRDLTATVANIREVDWGGLGINFALIFAPGLLEGAPQTALATAYAPPESEAAIETLVNRDYPGVTLINVRDALATVDKLVGEIGVAVRLTAAIALVAGTLVLAGAVAAGERRRIYDAVVLKVLGATRAAIVRAFLIEHGVLGLMAALIAVVLGAVAAWAVVVRVMALHWEFDIGPALSVAAIAAVITLGFGLVGVWRALGQRAAPLLRNE